MVLGGYILDMVVAGINAIYGQAEVLLNEDSTC
jgi:hypothetical protein